MKKRFLYATTIAILIVILSLGLIACNGAVDITLSFIVDGEVYHTIETKGDGSITLPNNPTKSGYVFDGWFWEDGRPFTANSLLDTPLSENMSVYARWRKDSYVVTFDGNGGDYISGEVTQTVEYGKAATAPVFAKEGYTLSWDKAFNNITSELTVTAVWTIKTYKVTFDGNGGDYISGEVTQTVEYGKAATAPVFTKEGYTLSWDKVFNNITSELTVTAVWTIKTYTVTFDGGGGNYISGEVTQTVEYGKSAIAPVFAKDGYIFNGWDKEFSIVTENIRITALWIESPNADITSAIGFTFLEDNNAFFISLPNVTETYSFINQISVSPGASWIVSTDIQGNNQILTKTIPLVVGDNVVYVFVTSKNGQNHSLYTFTVRRRPIYTVTYENADGTTFAEQFIEEDNCTTAPENEPLLSGYEFESWDFDFDKAITEDTIIKPTWNIITYSITYEGLEIGDINPNASKTTYTVETDTIEFEKPVRTGYTGSWDILNIPKGSTGDKVVTAIWTPIEYTITYTNLQNGTHTNTITTYTIESEDVVFEIPVRTGYTGSWDILNIPKGSTGDKVVTAIWTPIEYTITYTNLQNGTHTNTITTYTIESEDVVFEIPVRTGYTGSWDILNIPKGSTGDKVVTAIWTPIEYTITYTNLQNGTHTNTITTYTIESEDVVFEIPVRTGYTGSWDILNIPKGSTGDKVVTAIWTPIEYTITYTNLQNGTHTNTITTYTIESEDVVFEIPVRTGYTGSWDILNIPKGSTGDKVVTAIWTPIEYTITYTNLQNGTHTNTITTYTIESEDVVFEIPVRTGYTGSWDILNIPKGSTGDKVVTAIWEANKYCLTFEVGSGNIDNSQIEVSFDSEYTFEIPTHEYYTFGGWYTCIGGGGIVYKNAGVWNTPNDITLYAYWLGTSNLKYELTSSNSYSVSKGTGNINGTVHIQEYYQGKPVTSIGDYAFSYCSSLTSITIPDSVTSIGDYAFYYCRSLTSIVIGDSVTSIGAYAFEGCSSLTSIVIPDSVTSIGVGAFYRCSSLTSITIPDSVTSIGECAFEDCTSLTSITIPDSVTSIGDYAFSYCSSLTSITIPDSVTSIGDYAFYYCRSLTSIVIGDSVTSIGAYAFEGCSSLTSIVIPDSVTSIGVGAFYRCSSLTSITIPDSVTSIGECAFEDCTSLTSITIPDSVTSIGNHAFSRCTSLTSITIPDSVTSIGNYAFSSCSSLTSITIPDSVTSIGDYAFYYCSSLTSIVIPDSVTSIGYGAFYTCSSLTSIVIGDSVTSIGDYAFSYCSSLTSIVIGDSVTSIGDRAFYYCSSLTSIIIPDSVTSIGYEAFSYCIRLTIYAEAPSQPSGWDSDWNYSNRPVYWGITNNNFYEEDGLQFVVQSGKAILTRYTGTQTSIVMPSTITINETNYSVTSIGYEAFSYCYSLTSITIPDSVTSIGNYAFRGCSSLTSITIPDSVTSIGNYAFSFCSSLTSITIPDSVTSIGNYAFSYCSSLTIYAEAPSQPSGWNSNWNDSNRPVYWGINNFYEEDGLQFVVQSGKAVVTRIISAQTCIVIPSTITINETNYSVTSIGSYAFSKCSSLTSIVIPDSVTSIGVGAFWDCYSLTSITIPDSVTSIGDYAFYYCSSLTSIVIGDSVTSIGDYAFEGCSSLTSIVIPDSVTSIGVGAFYRCSSLTSITIPDSVTSIGDYAFYYCSSLTSIVIGDSVTSIGDYAFYYCSSLTSIVIGDSVTSIGDYAFYYCSSLTSIVIGDSVTSIGDYAFYYCSSLTSIVIGDSVTSIGDYAFYSCSSLTSIVIPDSVTSIGERAFYNCIRLTIYAEAPSQPSGWDSDWNYSNRPVYWGITNNNFYEEDGLQFVVQSGKAILTRYTGTQTSIVMPSTITINETNYSVTSIGDRAFYYCSSLTSIIIPDSVTSIGDDAFSSCYSLTSITIPDSVTSIGDYAFYYCSSLTIYAEAPSQPSGWNSNWNDSNRPVYWGINNFYEEDGLQFVVQSGKAVVTRIISAQTCIVIPSTITINETNYSVTSIGNYAFSSCYSLTSITIPDSVTSIGNYAFSSCYSLTSITIPDSVTSIGECAFEDCTSLTSITIPDSVTSIGDYAFYYCSSLTSIVIGDSVTSIGDYAFYYCRSLTSIVIGDSVTSIGDYAFYYCSSLTSIVIGDSVTSIGECAFSRCSSLTSITIPDSVTSIGDYAFYYCSSLTSIVIGDSVTSIGAYAFEGCSSLTSIVIPDSVTSIGECAFSRCSSLTSITIPDSVTSIGNYAFSSCYSLTSITIPDSVTSIGNYAFSSCYSLTSITIPDSVTSIGNYAFSSCYSLTSITIPDSVTSIGDYAFYYCSSLTSIVIPDSVTSIGNYAFSSCYSLTSITIPDSVTSIGDYAFYYCSSLTSIVIGDSVTSIGDYAFYYCSSLTSIVIGDSVTSIGDYAFYSCSSLTSIVIPDSVTSIGSYAFLDCIRLTIYAEAPSQPSGWDSGWNDSNRPVYWGVNN